MIYTNQVDLDFFHDAIERDFVILEARRDSGTYKESKVPDEALQYGQVLSVAYDWGNTCYILYRRKQADAEGLRRYLETCDPKTVLREIHSTDLSPHRLAQLLFNAMHQLGHPNCYHNLSGRLYERRPGWEKKVQGKRVEFWSLKISLDHTLCLCLDVQSFHLVTDLSAPARQPRYIADSRTSELRRLLKDDPDKNMKVYEPGPRFSGSRNCVDFLCFDQLDHFDNSKAGVLHRFHQDAARLLRDYLKLELIPMDESAHMGVDPKKREVTRVLDLLKTQRVYLEDLVQNEDSLALTNMLCTELEHYHGITLDLGTPEPGSIALQIIHNKEYFDLHPDEKDHYAQVPFGCILQHITVEDFQPSVQNKRTGKIQEAPCIKKVLLELAIKLDIHHQQLNCFLWPDLGFDRPVSFVTAHLDRLDGVCRYQRLTVSPKGRLAFDRWEGLGLFSDPVKDRIADAFLNHKQNFDFTVEGLIYEDPDQIQIIRRTSRFTLPDLNALRTVIRDNYPEEELETAPLLALVQERLLAAEQKDERQTAARYRAILDQLLNLGSLASRKQLKDMIGTKGKLSHELIDAYHANTARWIFRGMKGKDTAEAFFSGIMDIRCYRDEKSAYYYSGFLRSDLHQKLVRGCTIRQVRSTGGDIQIERYLPLMEVGFVRTSTWTVLPFPFKYLREWEKEQKNT